MIKGGGESSKEPEGNDHHSHGRVSNSNSSIGESSSNEWRNPDLGENFSTAHGAYYTHTRNEITEHPRDRSTRPRSSQNNTRNDHRKDRHDTRDRRTGATPRARPARGMRYACMRSAC